MTRAPVRTASSLSIAVLVAALLPSATASADPIKDALDRAMLFIQKGQNADGGYGPFGDAARVENASDVGITAFVIYAIACHPRNFKAVDGPFLSRAVDYLLRHQQPDGGFYHPKDPVLQNYRTCVALMALVKLDRVKYADAIRRARNYVIAEQRDERKRFDKNQHLGYGSVGHSGSLRGDLSNAAFSAEAMQLAGLSASEPFWKKLELFVSRCQNHSSLDPLVKKAGIGTTSDYGFRYAPNDTRGPKDSLDDGSAAFSSYGTMTYQGLKSLLYANVKKSDPRVQGAFQWLSKNFTVTENPGMKMPQNPTAGLQGLFYYYHTMSKTLQLYGEPVLTDGRGVQHNWAQELSQHLLKLQKPGGFWKNNSGRWWEDLPTLDTSYAMIALSVCREELARQKKEAAAGSKKSAAAPEENTSKREQK